jgi:hypothetical protein
VLQAVFLSWFLYPHTLQHIYFFANTQEPMNKKIKELQANTQNKNPRQKTA